MRQNSGYSQSLSFTIYIKKEGNDEINQGEKNPEYFIYLFNSKKI